jgi:hypothetical protein
MDPLKSIRDQLPHPNDVILDAEIWHGDSYELRDLAETIINRHPHLAWLIIDAWLSKHEQLLIDNK